MVNPLIRKNGILGLILLLALLLMSAELSASGKLRLGYAAVDFSSGITEQHEIPIYYKPGATPATAISFGVTCEGCFYTVVPNTANGSCSHYSSSHPPVELSLAVPASHVQPHESDASQYGAWLASGTGHIQRDAYRFVIASSLINHALGEVEIGKLTINVSQCKDGSTLRPSNTTLKLHDVAISDAHGNPASTQIIDGGVIDTRFYNSFIDSDGDGIADVGEAIYGLHPFDANPSNEDSDGDGLRNITEYAIGTDLLNGDTDGDDLPDFYEFNYSLDPLSASDAHDDADNDGLSNILEYLQTTGVRDPDSDNDGILDGYEYYTADLSPLYAADATLDFDGDGLNNLSEYNHGTDPHKVDTDNDGMSDFDEIALGRDPLLNIPAILIPILNLLL